MYNELVKNLEEEIDPHDIEKNKPGPVVFGLG